MHFVSNSDAEKILKDIRENKVRYLISGELNKIVQQINQKYNNDIDKIIHFWFDSAAYNLLDYCHRTLLINIFETVGVKHELVLAFLNNIGDNHLLYKLGITRLKGKSGKEYYKFDPSVRLQI